MMHLLATFPPSALTIISLLAGFVLLAFLSVRLASNLRFLRLARRLAAQPPSRLPPVSVLVPARNEEASITACVTSLLSQRYPALEVIVLNDGSTDETGARLDALQRQFPQLIVIHSAGEPLPGWNGKSYACHRLAERASGEWLLFTDADTVHTPTSVLTGVTQALALASPLLSAFPFQQTVSWSERLLVSFIIDFAPLVTIDFMALWRGRPTRIAANGQYLLAHAATYRAVGSHASVASALVDDFALAGRFHACGYPVALVSGASMLTCRMYHSFPEVWSGFSKNLLGGLTTTARSVYSLWWAPVFAWLYACVFVLPFFDVVFSQQKWVAGIEICWLLLVRGVVAWRIRRPLVEALATPLAAWAVMALSIGALYRSWHKQPIVWKERRYAA